MDYTTLAVSPMAHSTASGEGLAAVHSLYAAFQDMPDPRRGQGKRYELALVLCLLVLAKLAGQKTLSGATEWIRHRGVVLAKQFGVSRTTMPCQMTYCKILARLDAKRLDEILSAFFIRWEAQSRCGSEPSRLQTPQGAAEHTQVAIDGKTLRATCGQPHRVHQLSCYDVSTGIVLWHCNVGEKENEISALKALLTPAVVTGRILTLDAMHTQREFCAQVQQLAGDYVLIAKDNQPTLTEDIADLFTDPVPDRRRWKQAETWNKGHGRLEWRHLTASPDLNEWFSKQWQGIEQVFRLERLTAIKASGEIRHQIVYGLSSLSLRQAPPERMLELTRAHWKIENRLHWRRDVTLGEDACQTRTGSVPNLLAQLNSTVLCLLDRLGVRNVARQARFFDARLEQAVQLILTGSCSVF